MTTYPIGEAMTTITTAAALVALPHLSAVLVDKEGRACQRDTTFSPPRWWVTGTTVTLDDEDMLGFLPLTVLYRPDQPEPVKPTEAPYWCCRNCVARALQDAYAEWARRVEADGYMPETEYDAMADAVLAPLSVIPGQNPAELAAHDAEVAAKALEDAADAALSDTEGKLLPGVVGASWLRSRAAAIRAEAQR